MPSRYGLAIRAAHAGDAEGVAVLMRTAGLLLDARGLSQRLEAIPVEAGLVLLAEEWGPPSGILVLGWRWTLTDVLRVAEVTTLLVDPEQRR
jgi:hypothetical protein